MAENSMCHRLRRVPPPPARAIASGALDDGLGTGSQGIDCQPDPNDSRSRSRYRWDKGGVMTDDVLSLGVLTAIALVLGAIVLWRRGVRRQAALMLVLAVVMAGNVAIWSMPTAGRTLAGATAP